jgi:hypothetical protein
MATLGQGGSIPLCNVFAETYPAAKLTLMGVEEPCALIHAPNESADPTETITSRRRPLRRPGPDRATPGCPDMGELGPAGT